ncbi:MULTISPECIES: YccS family putative transporter [Edwardsiella]|uniref:Putative efflux (PET) family inner membrane protein YccS n=2 Tax=Edwardsiella anguillarum TaxID=1821960 RepID=A0A076LSL4_9GAMM|nr:MULTISPECIES: YccS family putative transporter [Edwardsiella]AIJ09652.1 Putative efflux (PET) family inner membrane protein YccS [Edwardsiella anguillarum ET080813]AKR77393.1 TIGR01666 family membrane protein [Edwardsiella sp. LADL05-105]KAB0592617.1 TIGR01666 family membrane protein [Edwardsiella anguillarum]UOU80434.1 YccS family putative transporter [Edwardsiella anguillarum]WHP85123.1 YccS family putative transporter [Edwardsiella anguillarum]
MSVFITFAPSLRRYAYNSALLYNLRIFIALAGAAGVPWLLHQPRLTIPLTLGVVAAALTDLDDRLVGRLRNLLITLVCFFIASASIELLFPYPWLFAGGLMLSTVGFILLGALGQRYATIAFGALLIAIYTMLGTSMYQLWYQQPLLLLLGAVWYNLLTLIVHLLFPIRPVQEGLARSYSQLAVYLDAKSNLFDPDQEEDLNQPLIDVAMANSNLVTTLNQTKLTLLTRLRGDRGQRSTRRMMHYYFVAQDIHERASSSHFQYRQLSDMFRYSDVLFRFQRLLMLQARACAQLSQSLILMQHYQHDPRFERAFCHLESTLERIATRHGRQHTLVKSLFNLLINLRAIDAQLANIESEQTLEETREEESTLAEDRITGWHDMLQRIRRQLTPQSALFRHAVRMALVLVVGYAFIQFTGMQHGYWIMLTSLFVCQPNYHATKRRLWLRIVGTLAGILIGLPVLYFVPSLEGQLLLIVISGVLFFAFRNVQYAHATMFITLLVLLCFNLLGEGFEVAGPRVFDTLLGCAIAWAAVTFIWPDWHFRQIPAVIARTLNADCRYLDAILVQYHQGKSNALAYRIARRDAHNCDAELASVVSNMSLEPRHSVQSQEAAFRLLCLNHTLLSYISALGAHRQRLDDPIILALLNDAVCYMDDALNYQDDEIVRRTHQAIGQLQQRLLTVNLPSDSAGQLVLQQISLMLELLPELTHLKASLV